MKQIHIISAILFLLIYIVKTILLLLNKDQKLAKITKQFRIPEMIISTTFLVTGIWMFVEIGNIKTFQIIKLVFIFASIPIAIIGFKRKKKALAVIATFMIILSYGLAEMAKKKPYPSKAIPVLENESTIIETSIEEEIYKANCVSCHGIDGKKGLSGASDLSVTTLSKNDLITVITNGRNNMAAYKEVLSVTEIEKVSEYIITLKK